ncbi:hypothetical protein F5876DRAFT_79342 [Lentinula aff. lateritia]|uniref:Uncharacterized protein n=1 Tax=Lentinula aff. lateritia TaxID=2804960 RepID=A0ACC1TU22_9AGAR|nr:hypothetical protein F5876DRAFT_79342 [Lentinula aff. lateritia]
MPFISSETLKANQAQFPAFFYPSALVDFAYCDSPEVREITRESGLSLYFSAETLRTIFHPFTPDQTKGDSFPLTEAQIQKIFDAAEPYLAKNNHSVLHARSVDPPDDGVVHRSEASQVVKSGFKRRKVSVDAWTPSSMKRVEDIIRDQSSKIEPTVTDLLVVQKKDQTPSSTHINYEHGQSVKTEHDNVADDVNNGPKKHKNKVISNRTAELEVSGVSDEYIPTARPLLLVYPKGHLVLPDLTGPEMEELDGIDRVQASFQTSVIIPTSILHQTGEPFHRSSLLFDLDESLFNLGTKLTAQNTHFNFADLVTISHTIQLPTIHDQACISLLSAEEPDTTNIELPLDLKFIPAMNNIFAVSGNNSDNLLKLNIIFSWYNFSFIGLGLMLQRLNDLLRHMELIESSYAQTRANFLQTMENLQTTGADPIMVLEALRLGEPEHCSISVEEMTTLATLFNWSSPLNFQKLDTAVSHSTAKWLQLLRKLHSGKTTLDNQGNDSIFFTTPKCKLSE